MKAGGFAQVVVACLCLAGVCNAEIGAATTAGRYFAEVSVDDPDALADLLNRAEGLVNTTPRPEPIVILLHGPEAEPFLRKNYTANRDVVDLAARLDAFKVVDVKVCETWMRDNQVTAEEMPAFIETVPYAPATVEQLEEAGYVRF